MQEKIHDKYIGDVFIVRNIQAKRIIARRKDTYVQLTVPAGYSLKQIESTLVELRERILELKVPSHLFLDENTKLETYTFSLRIKKENIRNWYISLKNNILQITVPQTADFLESEVQNKLKLTIEEVLRKEAKRILPGRVKVLAEKYGFTYTTVKINKSRSRWGSCSSKKNINLSYYCLFLPEHLIDYVILHELCHTIEMNHSSDFWCLLDEVTRYRARQLTNELRSVKLGW